MPQTSLSSTKQRLFFGALAGALGGLAMKAAVRAVDPGAFGLSAATDAKSAHELWRRMEWKPIGNQRATRIGGALHYSFSIVTGALYAASAAKFPGIRIGRGAGFGAALWLVGDEIAVSASGLEDPRQTPVFSHVSALGIHILYGLIVDAVISRPAFKCATV